SATRWSGRSTWGPWCGSGTAGGTSTGPPGRLPSDGLRPSWCPPPRARVGAGGRAGAVRVPAGDRPGRGSAGGRPAGRLRRVGAVAAAGGVAGVPGGQERGGQERGGGEPGGVLPVRRVPPGVAGHPRGGRRRCAGTLLRPPGRVPPGGRTARASGASAG